MRVYKTKDYEGMSKKAAFLMAAQINAKPDSVLGLATGSTPVGAYRQLIQWYREDLLDFSRITTINLDEYRGLSAENDQSYRYFMNHNLFDHVNIRKECTYLPDGTEPDSKKACREYDAIIKGVGGIDLQILGLGRNGHIGFNEPGDCFEKTTHCVDLTESTIEANKRFFPKEEDVPRQAYTMGIQTIMGAGTILLLVSGEEKAEILRQVICGSVTPRVPASILQMHPRAVVIADEAALSRTENLGE